MSECYYACKQIIQLCNEARLNGKNVIRIKKIIDIADKAIRADDSSIDDTRTHTYSFKRI